MTWRGAGAVVTRILFLLALGVFLTARPGDEALYPPRGADSHAALLVSHGWHSGIVLPHAALNGDGSGPALRAIAVRFRDYPQIEFGWGEARFYRATPSVSDVDWGLALKALFTPGGSDGVIQVVGLPERVRDAFPTSDIVPLQLSAAGLKRLLERLEASFRTSAYRPVEAGPGLYGPSLFYEGNGRFSFWNVCNHWTAGLLNAAGLPILPVLATLPRGLILDLEWRSGTSRLPARALSPPM